MRVMWKSLPSVARPCSQSGLVAHRAAEADCITSSEPVTPSRAGERRGDARLGRAPGVQRLGHRVHAERLLQAGGEGRHGGERMRELLAVELQRLGGGGGGAEAADGAGVVPVLVVRLAHRRADARGDLVADHDRPAGSSRQRTWPRQWSARPGGRCRRGRCRRLPPCARRCLRSAPSAAATSLSPAKAFCSSVTGGTTMPGIQRGVPVDHGAAGVMQHRPSQAAFFEKRRPNRRTARRGASVQLARRRVDALAGFLEVGERAGERDAEVRRQAVARAVRQRDAVLQQVRGDVGVVLDRGALRRLLADPAGAGDVDVERAVRRCRRRVPGSR